MAFERRPISKLSPNPIFPALLLALAPPAAGAEERLVPDQYASIQGAIAAALPGDEVRVSSAGSPYVEFLVLADGVSVRGGFSPDFSSQNPKLYETVIHRTPGIGGSAVSAEDIGASVLFEGFTVTGGDSTFAGGGMFCGANTFFTIRDCIFRGNRANITGGGMQIAGFSSVRVVDCLFENNFAGQRGGGLTIATNAAGAVIERCTVRACSTGTSGVQGGGGIFCASSADIHECRIENNFSGLDGGGLYVVSTPTNPANLRAWGNLFIGNRAEDDGGGIFTIGGSSVHNSTLVEGCVAGADGTGSGGGVYFDSGTDFGSSIFNDGFIRGNSAAAGLGGGMYIDSTPSSLVSQTEIVENNAAFGGGVYVEGGLGGGVWTMANFDHCSITRNEASGPDAGGGMHIVGQDIGEITSCIIADQIDGCGISCESPASPNIRFNDVFNNDVLNPDPEYGLNCTDRTGVNGNIKTDPRFCDPFQVPPDLALQVSSPCRGTGEGTTDMGAHDFDEGSCGTISVEPSTWGKIKALYR